MGIVDMTNNIGNVVPLRLRTVKNQPDLKMAFIGNIISHELPVVTARSRNYIPGRDTTHYYNWQFFSFF